MAGMAAQAHLRILGSSSAVPRPGRANSGYLLRSASAAVAVDFGSGVFSRLRECMEPAALDAIVISHMHADHFFDLVPLRYALKYESRPARPLPVYLPPGGTRMLHGIVNAFKDGGAFFDGMIELHEYDPQHVLTIARWNVSFGKTLHYIPAYAMRFEDEGVPVFAFSADTAPCVEVERIACDAPLFLCEAGLGSDGKESGRRGHLNAAEAGAIAARARAGHLIITHYGASARPEALRKAAEQTFAGNITVADDGMELPLGPR
jgi:ribonuclease BN (tRNA processing enzyme)